MRLFFLFTLCLFSLGAVANPWSTRIDMSATNIANTFPDVPQISGPPVNLISVQIDNSSTFELEVNCSSLTKPSSNATDSFYVAPGMVFESPVQNVITYPFGTTVVPPNEAPKVKVCWVRSVTGSANSGTLRMSLWGY